MSFDSELAAMLNQSWSNDACCGYAMKAMENCGVSPENIQRVMAELHEVFDCCDLEEVEVYYQNSAY